MAAKPLDWSKRAINDVDGIFTFYSEAASIYTALNVREDIAKAARAIQKAPLSYRTGKRGTREYVMKRYPFVVVYRVRATRIRVVRVLHQARDYFNS